MDVLPDLLADDLTLWFVGTAAGPQSAAQRAYYAKPGNRFWPTLHAIGVTPHRFAPHDFPTLLEHGVGLTDLCKTQWGVDSKIPRDAFDVDGLKAKIARRRPRAIAFTSRTAASHFFGAPVSSLPAGRVAAATGPNIFVLPSPSGLATRWWSMQPWEELGAWYTHARLASQATRQIPAKLDQ